MLTTRSLGISIALALATAASVAACGGNGSTGGNTGGHGGGQSTSTSNGSNSTAATGSDITSATTSVGPGTTSSTGTASTGSGGGLFQAQEPWNTPVDQEPKSPESDKIINYLMSQGGWASGGKFQSDLSIGIQYADASTPMKTFVDTGDFFSPDCQQVPFPVPPGGAVEGESGYACTQDGDCHLLVVHTTQNKLYEMWRAYAPPDPSTFYGGCVVVWDLLKAYPPNLRGDGCTSADAGGFPIAAMLATADEVAAGHVDHALRFILPNNRIRSQTYVHPGTHTTMATSGPADAPPYGVRMRLKASFDLNTLPSDGARVLAKALQKYGMFLADAGNIPLTMADDRFTTAKWADVGVDSKSLNALDVSNFEVVQLGTLYNNLDCNLNP